MSEGKIIKSWRAACLRQILLAGAILLIFMMALIGLVILSVASPIPQNQRSTVIFGGLMIVLVIMIAGVLVGAAYTIRRRAARLDVAFEALGLTGKAYLWNGRQYHGLLQGRQVDAYYYRGPSLDIYIASALNTRLGIGLKGRLSQVVSRGDNQPELMLNDPDFAHLAIASLDQHWARELLENSAARAAILRLTATQSGFEFRNLLFQPEAIQFQVYLMNPGAFTSENLRLWMDDLLNLSETAETLAAPLVTAIATPAERRMRSHRADFILPVMGITCGVFAFFAVIFIIVIILLGGQA